MRSTRSKRQFFAAAWSCVALLTGTALTSGAANAQITNTVHADAVIASESPTSTLNPAVSENIFGASTLQANPFTAHPAPAVNNSTPVTVTFTAQDRQIASLSGMTYASTIEPSQVPEAPAKPGFDFLGWFFGSSNSKTKYRVSVFPFNLSQIPDNVRSSIHNTIALQAVYGHNTPASPIEKPGYRLIFDDEFEGADLNSHNWVNKYLSSWSKTWQETTNHEVTNGDLSLRINADTQPWAPEWDGKTVISGIETGQRNGLHNWNGNNQVRNPADPDLTHINQYGYYEMRMRGQPGSSRHSAWWLLGFQDSPDQTTEIDIFEVLGRNPHGFSVALHEWTDHNVFNPKSGFPFNNGSKDLNNEYHTYGFDWVQGAGSGDYPDKITAYVDGVPFGSRNVNVRYPLIQLISQYEKRAGGWTGGWEWQPYPNAMNVDYVRVYKKIPEDAHCKENPVVARIDNPTVKIDSEHAQLARYGDFTEKHLSGTPSYVNVHWTDETVTQEPTTWEPMTEQDLEQLRNGETVVKQGTVNFSTFKSPVKTMKATLTLKSYVPPFSSQGLTLSGGSLGNLFDKEINDSGNSAVFKLNQGDANNDHAYISYNFGKKVNLTGIKMWTNYGQKQGIRTFTLAKYHDDTKTWEKIQENGRDKVYTLDWQTEQQAAEMLQLPVSVGETSRLRIYIKTYGYNWGHIAMREIDFVSTDVESSDTSTPGESTSPEAPAAPGSDAAMPNQPVPPCPTPDDPPQNTEPGDTGTPETGDTGNTDPEPPSTGGGTSEPAEPADPESPQPAPPASEPAPGDGDSNTGDGSGSGSDAGDADTQPAPGSPKPADPDQPTSPAPANPGEPGTSDPGTSEPAPSPETPQPDPDQSQPEDPQPETPQPDDSHPKDPATPETPDNPDSGVSAPVIGDADKDKPQTPPSDEDPGKQPEEPSKPETDEKTPVMNNKMPDSEKKDLASTGQTTSVLAITLLLLLIASGFVTAVKRSKQ